MIVVNARVFTADPVRPMAEAVAVAGARIVAVGSNADALARREPGSEVIDAQGCSLTPGIIDSHFHLTLGSLTLDDLQLDDVQTPDELAAQVRAYADAHPAKPWIVGRQLRYAAISSERPLDRHFLDALVPDRPVYLEAYDVHTAWGNTRAMQRAGLLAGRELPAGSQIVLDDTSGTATGELREWAAMNPVRDLLPTADEAATRALLRRGLAQAASVGITSVHNMDGDEAQVRRYLALEEAGELTLRVYVPYSVTPQTPLEELGEAAAWRGRFHTAQVGTGAIKLFMDGVWESYTALALGDYGDRPGEKGDALFTSEHFDAIALEADRLGLQIAVHACGDGAVRRTLDGYARAQRVNGRRDSRHRVEHIEAIHPDDVGRFAELGVIASMQPYHVPADDDSDVWPQRAGAARWPHSFAWETLRRGGATLAYGSDWPVVSMNPMLGLEAALTRRPWLPGLPDQRQTLENLLLGYTRHAAYTEFREQEKGMLRAGYLADLVLWDADLFAVEPDALREVRPRLTMCDGRVVYRTA